MRFADKFGFTLESPEYFYDDFRYQQWQEIKDSGTFQLVHSVNKKGKFSTVSAVACDQNGDVAAATSIGGGDEQTLGPHW